MNQRHMPIPLRAMPLALQRYVLHFEACIEKAVADFGASLPRGARVLDAGAGEGQYAGYFRSQRYVGLDLGVGDANWSYAELDAIADLSATPFADGTFDAVLNIVTLEHVREPGQVLCELARVLRPGGRLLLVTPHEWEEHQEPHDYFRYTRYGLEYLVGRAGFTDIRIEPVGGFFRLLSRRLLNGLQFFPGVTAIAGLALFAPAALLLPLFDGMDKRRNFTLGHVCQAQRRGGEERQ